MNLKTRPLMRASLRRIAFFALYDYDMSVSTLEELLNLRWYDEFVAFDNEGGLLPSFNSYRIAEDKAFVRDLIAGTLSEIDFVDRVIQKHLVNWDFERLHLIDKAILRLSVYSLVYRYDIPAEVSIFEANELAEDYSDKDAYKYINGILHRVKQEHRRNFVLFPKGKIVRKKLILRKKHGKL